MIGARGPEYAGEDLGRLLRLGGLVQRVLEFRDGQAVAERVPGPSLRRGDATNRLSRVERRRALEPLCAPRYMTT